MSKLWQHTSPFRNQPQCGGASRPVVVIRWSAHNTTSRKALGGSGQRNQNANRLQCVSRAQDIHYTAFPAQDLLEAPWRTSQAQQGQLFE